MKTIMYVLGIALWVMLSPAVYATSCLPETVKVLDENGNDVYINPQVLQQSSPYKGYLTFNQQTGYANFVPDELQTQQPCYDFPTVTTVTPAHKAYTIAPNQKLEIQALLGEGFKPRDEFTIKAISAEPAYGRANIKQNHSIVSYKPYKDWCGVDYLSYELQSETENLIEQVKINVSCAIDSYEEIVPLSDAGYIAKVFDADGDGLKDVYIQRRINGRHQDFYLKQKYGATFSLVTSTNSSQAIQASMLEESEIIVIRADFNADGMLDFLVSNIDAHIWGADEQIILAKKKDSSKLVPVQKRSF